MTDLAEPGRGGSTDDAFVEQGHYAFHDVRDAFNRNDVCWCLLRVPRSLRTPESDIDILLDRRQRETASHVLRDLGYVRVPQPGSDLHFVRYGGKDDGWLWLHITTRLAFGKYQSLNTGAALHLLNDRAVESDIPVLAGSDSFWALLLHCLLDKGAIKSEHRARLLDLVLTGDVCTGQLFAVVRTVSPDQEWSERMLSALKAQAWGEMSGLASSLRESWMRKQRIGPWTLRLRAWTWSLRGKLSRSRHRGITVAVLGPPGAGKSTLVRGLEAGWILPTHVIYMGLGPFGRMALANRLPTPILVSVARLCVIWHRYLVGQYHRFEGRLVIFDRYIYDAVGPPAYQLGWFGRFTRWIEGRACPGPDIVLLLDAPGSLMYSRIQKIKRLGKNKWRAEELDVWRQRFLTLRGRLPQLAIVDGTRPATEVCTIALELLWRRYAGEEPAISESAQSMQRNGQDRIGGGRRHLRVDN